MRGRVPGNVKSAGLGLNGPIERDWKRINLMDGTWTKFDPDSTLQSISNTGGLNTVEIDTTQNALFLNGCVHYREIFTPTGQSFNYTDKPVRFTAYVHLPNTGWSYNGSQSGGANRPNHSSRTYVIMGLMSDPGSLPTPKDVAGCGLQWQTSKSRMFRSIVRNTSSNGLTLNTSKSGLDTITSGDVSAGHKATNRLLFSFDIMREHQLTGGATEVEDSPRSGYLTFAASYDNGDRYQGLGNYSLGQRWGRGTLEKLFLWVAVGRGNSGASSNETIDFDCYYDITMLDGGVNPTGTTGLPD